MGGYLYITFFIDRLIFHQMFCGNLANTAYSYRSVCVCTQYSLLEYTKSWLVLQMDSLLETLWVHMHVQ